MAERQRLNVVDFTGDLTSGDADWESECDVVRRQHPLITQEHGTFVIAVDPLQRDPKAQIPHTPSQKPDHCVPGAATLHVSFIQNAPVETKTSQTAGHWLLRQMPNAASACDSATGRKPVFSATSPTNTARIAMSNIPRNTCRKPISPQPLDLNIEWPFSMSTCRRAPTFDI